MIEDVKKITCDKCNNIAYFKGNINQVIKSARKSGWVFSTGGTCFCCKECFISYRNRIFEEINQ